jgi:hypothetical protein
MSPSKNRAPNSPMLLDIRAVRLEQELADRPEKILAPKPANKGSMSKMFRADRIGHELERFHGG